MNSDGFPVRLESRWIVYFFFFFAFFLAAFFFLVPFFFATFFFAISDTSMLNKKLSMGWLTRKSHADPLYFDCSEKGFQQKNEIRILRHLLSTNSLLFVPWK